MGHITNAVLLTVLVASVHGYNNGLGRKPPLGWQTWCSEGPCGTDHCFDFQIKETAKAMVDNGMKSIGYDWIILDDCWHPERDSNGTLVPHKEFFPDGMVPVIEYVHSLGLKFGLSITTQRQLKRTQGCTLLLGPGLAMVGGLQERTSDCTGGWSPGSYGHFEQDANLFAGWGVDYVKVDWCGDDDFPAGHKNLSKAMSATGRHMALELCRGSYQSEDKWGYAPDVAQLWRASGDHHDSFNSTLGELAAVKGKATWSGPYGWAYLDMMMTGGEGCDFYNPKHCPKQTDNEYRTEFSLYALVASPLMVGTDIRLMTPIMNETLLNTEVLAINQDYEAIPGDQVENCGSTAWVRKLTDGTFAVGLPNLSDAEATMKICFSDIGWTASSTKVRDIWGNTTQTVTTSSFERTVAVHDTLLVILSSV